MSWWLFDRAIKKITVNCFMIKNITALFIVLFPLPAIAGNSIDTLPDAMDHMIPNERKIYFEKNGDSVFYNKPKTLDFITQIPGNAVGYAKQSFRKENVCKVAMVAAATTLLIVFDQQITNGVQSFGARNNINGSEQFDPIVRIRLFGKETNIGKWPKNFNTAVYNIGQGSSVILMAAGFLISGKINKDSRALQTASQLGEAFLALGLGTQIMKYSTGRENPSHASVPGGGWRPFPSFSSFQNNKPKYDAFPSGHLATFVSAITIISENYSSKKWIRPVGYTIAGLLSFAMINNGVHWAGDYPLGFALGYGYGKYISRKNKLHLKTGF